MPNSTNRMQPVAEAPPAPHTGNPGDLAKAKDSGGLWYALKTERVIDDTRPLPTPTRDPAEMRLDLDTFGYCLVADALPSAALDAMRRRVLEQLAAERRTGVSYLPPEGGATVSNLLNKGAVFARLLLDPLVDEGVAHLLGRSFVLSALNANITLPGSSAQGLHIDQHFAGFPAPIPLVANVCWMIDDFTETNGATRVIPGSHRWSPEKFGQHYQGINNAAGGRNPPHTIPAAGKAGTAMIFEGRMAHAAGRNNSKDQKRVGIFQYCCRGWVRGVENPFLSISDDIMASFPQKVRDRLGYKPSGYAGGYQMAGNPAPVDIIRPTDQVREMT